jgi:hypothetical protein
MIVSANRFTEDQYIRKETAVGLPSHFFLFVDKQSPRRTASNFDFGTLVQTFQGQFDTIGFKTHHHVTTYGYDRDPEGTPRYLSHFLERCFVFCYVVGSKRNPLLGKELLCLFAVGSGGGGVYLYFLTHGNLLYRTKIKFPNLSLLSLKLVLGGAAYGTSPVIRQILKLRARVNPVLRISICRVIHITTHCAYITVHNFCASFGVKYFLLT